METRDVLTIIAILAGPALAVAATMWWQRRKEIRDAKERLFLTLMAHRRSFPPAQEWVNSLNVIDVVYSDQPKVLDLWHRYYDSLHGPADSVDHQAQSHTYLLMLAAIARSLGYKNLEITDIDKFYSPRAHGDQMELNYQTQVEWLRVLRNTAKLETTNRDPADLLDQEQEERDRPAGAGAIRPR